MSSITATIDTVGDIGVEQLEVGVLYKDPNLLVEYGDRIKSKYDFHHERPRFFFESLYEIFVSNIENGNIDETKINIFMNQNKERKHKYEQFGGYQFIKRLVNVSDAKLHKKYFDDLKKWSLLRELSKRGFPVDNIIKHKHFNKWSAQRVYEIFEASLLSIQTDIGGLEDSIILGKDMPDKYEQWKVKPDYGINIPYPRISGLLRGWRRKKLNLWGMHSGVGKSRTISKVAADVGIRQQIPLLILVNEQDQEEWDAMILSAVVNNPEFGFIENPLTDGIDETKIVTGKCNKEEDEICKKAAKWISENSKIHWLQLSKFNAKDLKRQLKLHKLRGINYFIYDTLKPPEHDWKAFLKTGDTVKELCGELDMGGIATFQLTDDSLFDELLTSKAIANGRHIKHIADGLVMSRMMLDKEYKECLLLASDEPIVGTPALDPRKNYLVSFMDKNRGGKDKDRICIEYDKGKNYWREVGFLQNTKALNKDTR